MTEQSEQSEQSVQSVQSVRSVQPAGPLYSPPNLGASAVPAALGSPASPANFGSLASPRNLDAPASSDLAAFETRAAGAERGLASAVISKSSQPTGGGANLPYGEQVARAKEALPRNLPTLPSEVLLALDIDGTLLAGHHASDRVRKAIAEASEAGINVVIATGRSLPETRPALHEVGYHSGYMVSSNGARTVIWERTRDGRSVYHPLREWKFEPAVTAERLKRAMPQVVFGVDQEDGPMLVSSRFADGELVAGQLVTQLQDMIAKPTTRMIVREENLSRDQFAEKVALANLDDVEVAVGWTSWADVTAKGCTKGRGLQDLAVDLGVPANGTVAIGDGENDIAMLQWASHGVAMGNAGRKVWEAADAVTGNVRVDGAAAVIEALTQRY